MYYINIFLYRFPCHFFVLTTFWRHLWSLSSSSAACPVLLDGVNIRMSNWGSQVGVALFICATHLCDRTWAGFQSISTWLFSGFQSISTWLFLRFSSLSKIDSQSKTSGLGAVLRDHAWPFGGSLKHLSYAFGRSRLSYALRSSALGVASKSD